MGNVLQIDNSKIDEAIIELNELTNEVDGINVTANKQSGDEGQVSESMIEGEKIIECIKTDLKSLIQATSVFLASIKNNFETADQTSAEQIKGGM